MCAICREKRIYTRVGKKMIKQLVGLLNAATGVFHLSGRGKKGGVDGGIYSHASYSKVVGLHVLNVKKNNIFFMRAVCSAFLSCSCNTTDLRPSGRRVFQWSDARVLQSRVFVFISTGINRLSRQRSRPSAITGPEAGSSTCFSIFTK